MSMIENLYRRIVDRIFFSIFRHPYSFAKIKFLDYLTTYYQQNGSTFNFIQVGANDGISHDVLFHFVTSRSKVKGIVIEPIKDYFNELVINYLPFSEIIPVNIAIHPTLKKVELFRLDKTKEVLVPSWAKGIASLHPKHHLKSQTPTQFIVKEIADADTLMNIYEKHEPHFVKVDLIQIDVEGFDWEIIKMINFKKIAPLIIKYEWVNLRKIDLILSCLYLKNRNYTIFNEGGDFVAIKKAK